MSHEQKEPSRPVPPAETFGLTEHERLWDRVGHERFLQILTDSQTTVHALEESHNNYGEYLFVTLSRPGTHQRIFLTFYGLGYHEYRERWVYQEWYWHESGRGAQLAQKSVSLQDARWLIEARYHEIQDQARQAEQSNRGRIFELLADLTDEDGAWAEMQDLPDWLLDGDDEDLR